MLPSAQPSPKASIQLKSHSLNDSQQMMRAR